MDIRDAIKLVDKRTRALAITKYENIGEAYEDAVETLLVAFKRLIERPPKDIANDIYHGIIEGNLEGEDDDLVVIEASHVKTIIESAFGYPEPDFVDAGWEGK